MPLTQFLLPAEIYTHVSARVDVGLYVFERLLRPLWVTTLLVGIAPGTEALVMDALSALLGSGPGLHSHWLDVALQSGHSAAIRFAVFSHSLRGAQNSSAVGHSQNSPFGRSAHTAHPVPGTFLEGPIYAIGAALSFGIAAGLFGWLFSDSITQATLFNIGFFALLFGFNGSFRHYHVAFHYPRWLSKWLHSPVMHHTHHSYLEHHWDTNQQRSPAFGIGCSAPSTSPKKTNTHPGVWDQPAKVNIGPSGRTWRDRSATGVR